MRFIAHRGVSSEAPENTLRAFSLALEQGWDGIECDVWPCQDGLMVIHDADLERTTDGEGNLADFTVEALQRLDAGNGEKIPTLQEVLDLIAGRMPLFIELKTPAIAEAIGHHIAAALKSGVWQPGELIAIHPEGAVLQQVQAVCAEAAIGIHLLPDQKDPHTHLEQLLTAYHPSYILPEKSLVDQTLVETAHAAGCKVTPWTVNDPQTAATLRQHGVDGIISDGPKNAVSVE